MSKIVISGNYSKLVEETDLEFLALLDKHLSFYVIGAEHTAAFRGFMSNGKWVRWDGWKKLMTSKGVFASGLVERVKDFYKKYERLLEIEDIRSAKSLNTPIDISHNLKKLGLEPRDYQIEAANLVDKYDRGIMKLPTGSGKTALSAMMVAKLGKNATIFVVGKDLLHQFHNLFSSVFDKEIGIIGDGQFTITDINIASVWTVAQALGMKSADILLDDVDDEKQVGKDKYVHIQNMLKSSNQEFIYMMNAIIVQLIRSAKYIKILIQNIYLECLEVLGASKAMILC
jgi:hypothetical protein